MQSRHVSVVIGSPPEVVYEYAANPDHLPLWAAGLARSPVSRDADALIVDSPMGRVRIQFVAHNTLGVLDHDVTLPSGEIVTNPLRVLKHPSGAEVVFTVRRRDMTDAEFDRDVAMIEDDLHRLKQLLESAD